MTEKDLLKKTLSGFAWLLGGTAAHSILRIVFVAILARLLSPDDFGLMASAMIIVKFSEVLAQMGIGPALVQREELNQKHMESAFTLTILIGGGLYALFLLLNPLLSVFFRMPELHDILNILCLVIPIRMLSQISYSMMQRKMLFKKLAGWDVVSYGLGYGAVGIILAYLDYGVYALVYAVLCQSIIYTIILFIISPHALKIKVHKKEAIELLRYGLGFTLSTIFNFLARTGDTIVVGRYLGKAELGLYDRSYVLMNIANNVIGKTIGRVMFPAFATIQNDEEKLSRAFSKALNVTFGVLLPLTPFLVIYAEEIVAILLGPQWGGAVLPFQLLAGFVSFRVAYKVTGTYLKGVGLVYYHSIVQFIYMLVVLGGSYLVKDMGIKAVAANVGLALALNFWIQILFINRKDKKAAISAMKAMLFALPMALIVTGSGLLLKSIPFLQSIHPILMLSAGGIVLLISVFIVYLAFKSIIPQDVLWLSRKFTKHRKK